MTDILWWGYFHINGGIQVKRFFSYGDITEAKISPFVKGVVGPFKAKDREDALTVMQQLRAQGEQREH